MRRSDNEYHAAGGSHRRALAGTDETNAGFVERLPRIEKRLAITNLARRALDVVALAGEVRRIVLVVGLLGFFLLCNRLLALAAAALEHVVRIHILLCSLGRLGAPRLQ